VSSLTGSVAARGATPGTAGTEQILGDLDLPEYLLTNYSHHVVRYTTGWGTTVDDWYPAFSALRSDVEETGGGRVIVPAGEFHTSGHVVFDVPAVSVHLRRDAHVELVGEPDVFLGAPLCFYGNAKRGEPIENRIQRDFAAVLGPGSVGYPANQLDRYPHENGVGMSYIKTAIMDGVRVPHVPGKGLTAQFGCNRIIIRNCTIGATSVSQVERDYPGQASIVAQGGDSFTHRPPQYPLYTTVTIENNTIQNRIVRGIYASFCDTVSIRNNTVPASYGAKATIKAANSMTFEGNRLGPMMDVTPTKDGIPYAEYRRASGVPEDGVYVMSVAEASMLSNSLLGSGHRHCVYSGNVPELQIPSGVIYARHNHWSKGSDTIFGGSPPWDSDV
jgi:parallel beta-helix repeat protein